MVDRGMRSGPRRPREIIDAEKAKHETQTGRLRAVRLPKEAADVHAPEKPRAKALLNRG